MENREVYFPYGDLEIEHLTSRDARLGAAIERIGPIERPVRPNLFEALIHAMVGQQISTKAQETIWRRLKTECGEVTPQRLALLTAADIQRFGLTMKKAAYIQEAAAAVHCGECELAALAAKSDEEVCRELARLNGIGVWTAEMLLLFSLQRPNVLSYGDLAIQRGMRMLYHHRHIDKKRFSLYHRRYSPYASVASLYLWAIAGGALPEMKDYAPKRK